MSKEKQTLHIYIRVSTTGQEKDGTSLDSQLKLGKAKAKSLGMDYEVHDERSASSSKDDLDNRPVIKELLARIAEGEIKHIYVYSIDRLSRNTSISTFIRETLRKAKCTLYTNTNETNLDSLEQNLLYGIISEISQYENMLRTERMRYGKIVKAKDGYWMGGPTPFGYTTRIVNKKKKLTLDKEQSPWVEKIFKWYSEGMSSKDIKHKLDGRIDTNRGKPLWSYGSIESMLKNPHPSGSYTYKGHRIPCPRIVDEETLELVQKRLNRKKRLPRGNNKKIYSYPLREIMFCGHCGTQMCGRSKTYSENKQLIGYVCSSSNKKWKESSKRGNWKRGKYCQNNVSMECNRTEDVVWESLLNILELSHQERELFKWSILDKKNKKRKNKDKEIEKIKTRIENTKISISRLEEGIVEKEIEKISSREKAKPIQIFIDKLQEELNRLSNDLIKDENDLVILENDNLWINWIKDYKNNLDKLNSLTREERIEEIKKYIKRIDVFFNPETRKHRLDLKLKLPIIGDTFKWKDELKKKKGYVIGKGSNEKVIELDSNVRNVRSNGQI